MKRFLFVIIIFPLLLCVLRGPPLLTKHKEFNLSHKVKFSKSVLETLASESFCFCLCHIPPLQQGKGTKPGSHYRESKD